MPQGFLYLLACATAFVTLAASHATAQNRNRAAGTVSFYVAPGGSDTNDCLSPSSPCASPQAACSKAMNEWDFAGYDPFVRLSPGVYNGGCNIAGQPVGAHTINIVGAQSDDQSCTLDQAGLVTVFPGATQEGGGIFVFQDLAAGVLRCMTLEGPGSIGVQVRQTPVSDIAFVKFGGDQALETAVTAGQNGGVNLGGTIWVGNNHGSLLAVNGGGSRITVAAQIQAVNPVSITNIAQAYQLGFIEFVMAANGPSSFAGPILTQGSRVWRAGMISSGQNLLPGGCSQADPTQPGSCY